MAPERGLSHDAHVSVVPKECEGLILQTPRLRREQKTIDAMLRIWCRAHPLHVREKGHGLCAGCDELLDYASYRLHMCPYGEEKPVCKKCPVHCYTKTLREQMQDVMRFAGPRMLFKHPVLAFHHMRDGKREAPPLGKRQKALGAE
jgi:hypothetical protein